LGNFLARVAPLQAKGSRPQVMCRPFAIDFILREPAVFASLKTILPLLNRPVEVQSEIYRSADFRQKFRDELKVKGFFGSALGHRERITIIDTKNPALAHWKGKTLADVCRARGQDSIDVMFDLALEDHNLGTHFSMPVLNINESRLGAMINHPGVLLGLSDGGAHVNIFCHAGFPSHMLGTWVRERGEIALERAVQRMTSEPADFLGLRDRGRVAAGKAADLAVFDLNTIGEQPDQFILDLPGAGRRIVTPAKGVTHPIVNGAVVFEEGKYTGATPGQHLRA
jgi:N-acyl-D-aspartate/D-glutamate deacylase